MIHHSFLSDRARGLRKVIVQERWDKVKVGRPGLVYRRLAPATQRAVKVLRRMSLQFQTIEYNRELEPLAKFDKLQVGDYSVVLFYHFFLFYL